MFGTLIKRVYSLLAAGALLWAVLLASSAPLHQAMHHHDAHDAALCPVSGLTHSHAIVAGDAGFILSLPTLWLFVAPLVRCAALESSSPFHFHERGPPAFA